MNLNCVINLTFFGQFIRIKVVLENSPAVFIRVATAEDLKRFVLKLKVK
jgi:hypothetical protein